jgi:drug/metabolite transporter (DMT)-like permease
MSAAAIVYPFASAVIGRYSEPYSSLKRPAFRLSSGPARLGAIVIIVFALAAAVLYGSADFLGGAVSRRTHVLSVLIVSAPAGAVVLLTAALAVGGPIGAAGLPWAAAAGAAGGTGLIMFYAGLAAGPMRVVAPVSALVSTVLPVSVAIAGGERPGTLAYLGGGICLVATVLVSSDGIGRRRPDSRPAGRGLLLGAGGGVGFGLFFLFLQHAGASGGLAWRAVSPWLLAGAVASGLLDAAANVCYVVATRDGLFGIAVVLTSLYPGVTVLLARLVLGERMRFPQLAGLLLALAGIALVSA